MAHYTFSIHVDAPPERVFALWTNLERMGEWVGGVTGVTDISGPVDRVGTTYVVHFGAGQESDRGPRGRPAASFRYPVWQLDPAWQIEHDV